MSKQLHPGVVVTVIAVALVLVLYTYYKKTEPPPTAPMNPLGPGAAYLRQHPGSMENAMSPAEKQMMAHSRGGTTGSASGSQQSPSGTSSSAGPAGGK